MLKGASILGYVAMIVGILGLLWMHSLFWSSVWVIIPQALAILLGIWARITFGRRSFHVMANPTAGGLVMTGPDRLIRHPIYAAVCLFTVPPALAKLSWIEASFATVLVAGMLVRVFCEEKLVVAEYRSIGSMPPGPGELCLFCSDSPKIAART